MKKTYVALIILFVMGTMLALSDVNLHLVAANESQSHMEQARNEEEIPENCEESNNHETDVKDDAPRRRPIIRVRQIEIDDETADDEEKFPDDDEDDYEGDIA